MVNSVPCGVVRIKRVMAVSGFNVLYNPLPLRFNTLQVNVKGGCGQYIPHKPFSDAVYSRILQRDKMWVPEAVQREPYSGPVIQLK